MTDKLLLTNKVYDVFKFVAMIILPAVGTLYFALAGLWHFPYGSEVVGSITAFDTFLGVLVHTSHSQYMNSDARFDGQIDIDEHDDKKTYLLGLHAHPDVLDGKDAVTFKVNSLKES